MPDELLVRPILNALHFGYRTRIEVERCGCAECQEALKRLAAQHPSRRA